MIAWNPCEDGVTHINVYSKGRTEMGRWLSNFAHTPFLHPTDGVFSSIEGYWYWLSCAHPRREELRAAHGVQAKQLGRLLRGADWPRIPDFQTKIKQAIRLKFTYHPAWLVAFQRTTLPLAHYYVYSGGIHVVYEGQWILDEMDAIRKGL